MKRRDKRIYIIAALLVVVVALLLALYLFPGTIVPRVDLADQGPGGDGTGLPGHPALHVEITRYNVQNVLATLYRADYYVREIRQTRFWSDGAGSASTTAEIWATPDVLRIRWANGENMILSHDTYTLWHEGRAPITRPVTAAMGESLTHILDEFQGIPSYEALLELDPEQIIRAGYTRKPVGDSERYVIFLSVQTSSLGYVDYYYIELDSGLLVEMETWDGSTLVYHIETIRLDLSAPPEDVFLLPERRS
ncbi:MAG: hypothetical protein FWD99_08420 [Oscillospiraceae bacterium]|nr:hypothetical protein [Oscillospiraceae bacterium]